MMRMAMSPAASGLLRALVRRAGCARDRILLTELRSVEWQSLTFVGERHQLHLRIAGDDASSLAARIIDGLEDAEFVIPGAIVADVRCEHGPEPASDGAIGLRIEALTIED